MAKKKIKKDPMCLVKKGIALASSILVFVFMFLEFLALKSKGSLFGKESEVSTEGVKLSEVLFNEDFEAVRENLGTTTTVLWVSFIFVILAVVVCALSLFIKKKGSLCAKIGSVLLVAAMLVLFVVNTDKATFSVLGLASAETWISNITALYFVSLVLSVAGLVSSLSLKK